MTDYFYLGEIMSDQLIVIFVHGWSVHNTDTYGELPKRLLTESSNGKCPVLDVRNIWLSKYISFKDEVRVEDISRGFEAALRSEIGAEIDNGRRFVCITHSTGGPVARDWWKRFYLDKNLQCPMSHLIMLAPANFGSALAQLGKARLSRIKSWFDGVEPGQGVLDWLELGSEDAYKLNQDWICNTPDFLTQDSSVFPFVLTGQKIDHKLYDNLNNYTGELGSDGVVRVAAANLNATYVKLEQQKIEYKDNEYSAPKLTLTKLATTAETAFAIIKGRSHSGDKMGILKSVRDNGKSHPTVTAILKCLNVDNVDKYEKVCQQFEKENIKTMQNEKVEKHHNRLFPDNYYIRDHFSMLIVRVFDNQGLKLKDYDLLFTGRNNNPNYLPPNFFKDRQKNSIKPGNITYFVNYDKMSGCVGVKCKGLEIRKPQPGIKELGMQIQARPDEGFVHYLPATLRSSVANIQKFLKPNQTTLVDIVLKRVVHEGVFELTKELEGKDFRRQEEGKIIK